MENKKKSKYDDPSFSYYRLGSSKVELPNEMIRRMRDMKDLYLRKLPQSWKNYETFKKLFYSPKTSSTTRAIMIDAALHQNAERPTEKLNHRKELRDEFGVGKYIIDVEMNAKGEPTNFAIVHIKAASLKASVIRSSQKLRMALRRSNVDPASARLAQQALSRRIDPQRGLKMQTAVLEIMKLIMMIKLQLEAIVRIHDKEISFIDSPTGKKRNARLDDTVKDAFGHSIFYVQFLSQHCDHYLGEGRKFNYFYDLLECGKHWNLFVMDYVELRDFGLEYGNKEYDDEEIAELDRQVCELAVRALNSLMEWSDYIMRVDVSRGRLKKNLMKMSPTIRVPQARSHVTEATWKIDSEKLYIENYSRRMKDTKAKLDTWKTKWDIKS